MSRSFNSTFRITVHYNDYRKKTVVIDFRDQMESARFFLDLEDRLKNLTEDARSSYPSMLVPISIVPNKIPPNGMKVRFRSGECFDEEIRWDEPKVGTLLYQHDINPNGECGIIIREMDGFGFAGYNAQTKTYWRYQEEASPSVYREHCLQILEVL